MAPSLSKRAIRLVAAAMLAAFCVVTIRPAHAALIESDDGTITGARTTGQQEVPVAQPTEAESTGYEIRRAIYAATTQYKIQSRGNQGMFALMALEIAAARDGKSAKEIHEISAKALQAQHKNAATRKTGKWMDPDLKETTYDVAGMLGDLAGKQVGGGGTATAATRTALSLIESALSGKMTYRAYRRHAVQRLDDVKIQHQLSELYFDTHHEFPQLAEASSYSPVTFELGFSPDSSREDMIAATPDKTMRDGIQFLTDNAHNTQALLGKSKEMFTNTVQNLKTDVSTAFKDQNIIIEKFLKDEEKKRANLLDAIGEISKEDYKRSALAIKVRGLESTVYLAATLIKLGDPKLGHQIQTIGDASIKVYKAWENFEKISKGLSHLQGFANVALTADVVGAALAVVGLFIDTGPTADEVILEQIGELRDQVEQNRVQMHQRFSLVDRRLVAIHQTLVEGLDKLRIELAKGREEAAVHSAMMQQVLLAQRKTLEDQYFAIFEGDLSILTSIKNRALAPCIRRKDQDRLPISLQLFGDCVAQIRSLALDGDLENGQRNLPQDAGNIVGVFEEHPDAMVKAAIQKFDELSTRPTSLSSNIVGPESWIYIAQAHDQFLYDWPEHLSTLSDDPSYAQQMNRYREGLTLAIRTISRDLAEFADGAPDTTFGALVDSVRKKKHAIDKEMYRAAEQWEAEEYKESGYWPPQWAQLSGSPDSWHGQSRGYMKRVVDNDESVVDNDEKRTVYMGWACRRDIDRRRFDNRVPEEMERRALAFWFNPNPKLRDDEKQTGERKGDGKEKLSPQRIQEVQKQRFDTRIKKQLYRHIVPKAFEDMLAVGMGTLEICVLGDITRMTSEVTKTFSDGDLWDNNAIEGAYHVVNLKAMAVFKVLWKAECEGQQVQIGVNGKGYKDATLEVRVEKGPLSYSKAKATDHKIHFDTRFETDPKDSLRRALVWDAYQDARRRVEKASRRLTEELEKSPCVTTYKRRFMEKRKEWIKTVIQNSLDVRTAIGEYDMEVKKANAYLRSWVRFALHDAIPHSDAVAAIATANVRFPLWEDAAEITPEQTLLDRPERLETRIQTVESVLRSEEIAYLAGEHYGYAGVTDTAYESLDPAHPDVQRFWESQASATSAQDR